MNIAFVVHHYDRSEGTGGYVVELVHRLAERHRVTVYARSVRAPVPPDVEIVRVHAFGGPSYATVLTFPWAFERVRQSHDVVHAQGWVTNTADVVTAHIVLHAWRRAARAAGVRTPPGERFLGGVVERREQALVRSALHVIAPSEKVRDELAASYGSTRNTHVIAHGFSKVSNTATTADARARLRIPESPETIALYIGDARKGLRPAMHAVARVPDVRLLVVGHSPSRPYLAEARDLRLAGRITWAGPLPDPTDAFHAADLLLHPTIYDAFGLVVAEAMSHGLPVIVPRTAGISELIEHDHSGWITEDSGVEITASALRRLASDHTMRQRLGTAGREIAARRTWDHVAEETLAVYEMVSPR